MNINRSLAQEIVNKVMKVIPYNVNIMNEDGMIIGSGDHGRIGTYHQGAISAIEQESIITVYNTEGGTKPGVNIPIHFRNRIIGVIGISGEPDIVSHFAELVRITGELLINQEFLFKEQRIKEQIKEEFLYQWIFRHDEYDDAFIDRGESLDIDLSRPRKAIIVKGLKGNGISFLHEQEYSFHLNTNTLLYIVPDTSDILKRIIAQLGQQSDKIGIGGSHTHVANSVHEAKRAIEIVEKLQLSEKVCQFSDLKFFDYLTSKKGTFDDLQLFFSKLEDTPKGIELLETLISFIENSGDMNAIAEDLHIHRNSLAYRLQKIEQLSNKNPKNYFHLFQLFTGYVIYKMHSDNKREPSPL